MRQIYKRIKEEEAQDDKLAQDKYEQIEDAKQNDQLIQEEDIKLNWQNNKLNSQRIEK